MFRTTSAAQLVLLGAASVVAALGITAVAYGAANSPTPVDPEPTAAVASDPAADAVSAVAIVDTLDPTDADGIAFMREEETLARDVYRTLADVWDLRIFSNIARAEQTHMDSILGLLEAYGLRDPAENNDVGVFENPELQQMYDELTSSGSQSIEAALNVGALIEEVDIEDLAIYLDATLPTDVATVYDRLLNGSENHLRAFVSQLERVGIEHKPTVLDTDIYASIISSENQQGGARQTRDQATAQAGEGGTPRASGCGPAVNSHKRLPHAEGDQLGQSDDRGRVGPFPTVSSVDVSQQGGRKERESRPTRQKPMSSLLGGYPLVKHFTS